MSNELLLKNVQSIVKQITDKPEPTYGKDPEEPGPWKLDSEVKELCAFIGEAQSRWHTKQIKTGEFAEIIADMNNNLISVSSIKCSNAYKQIFKLIDLRLGSLTNSTDCPLMAVALASILIGVNLDSDSLISLIRSDFGKSLGLNANLDYESTRENLMKQLSELVRNRFKQKGKFSDLNVRKDPFTGELFFNEDGDPRDPSRLDEVRFDFLLYQKDSSSVPTIGMYIFYVDGGSVSRIGELMEIYIKLNASVLKLEKFKALLQDTFANYSSGIYFYSFDSAEEVEFFRDNLTFDRALIRVVGTNGSDDMRLPSEDADSLRNLFDALDYFKKDQIRIAG